MRTPAEDSAPADWLEEQLLRPWSDPAGGNPVGAIVPTGFAAYARILHSPDPKSGITWAHVAAATGRTPHRLMEWHRIVTPAPGTNAVAWDRDRGEPLEGEPSDAELHELAGVLRKFTSAPGQCWFCSWVGFGGTEERGAQVVHPSREYFLSSGSIDEVTSFERGPNLWWPEDRAWCVASEIDLLATYVGGSQECVEGLLDADWLEAIQVSAADRVDSEADMLNRE